MPKERIKQEARAELAEAILKFAEKLEYEVVVEEQEIDKSIEVIIINDHNKTIHIE